jgi:SulP family sulfate permease
MFRFESAIVFFNADHFKERVRAVLSQANPKPRWFLFSAECTPGLDITGVETLEELRAELEEQGIVFAIAKPRGRFESMLKGTGVAEKIGPERIFPTIRAGVAAFRRDEEGRL